MRLKSVALIVGAMLIATNLNAQETAAPEKAPQTEPSKPPTTPAAPSLPADRLDRLASELKTQFDSLRSDIQALQAVGQRSVRNAQAIDILRRDINNLDATITEHVERQRKLLEAVTQQETVHAAKPALDASTDSTAWTHPDTAVGGQNAAPETGLMHLNNRTRSYQTIAVNGVFFGIKAGTTLTLKAPVGEVITQIPGRAARSWKLTSAENVQRVDLIPASEQRTTTLRPALSGGQVYYYYPTNRLFPGNYWWP